MSVLVLKPSALNAFLIVAKVNLFSPDHISLLIHRTFNISIPRNHIPEFEFEFDDQASRFPGHGADVDIANSMDVDDGSSSKPQIVGTLPKGLFGTENSAEIAESMGRWVRRSTGEKVGGDDGLVEFTVIGSVGSLLNPNETSNTFILG